MNLLIVFEPLGFQGDGDLIRTDVVENIAQVDSTTLSEGCGLFSSGGGAVSIAAAVVIVIVIIVVVVVVRSE